MKKIYIVLGTTGEYADQCEWPVIAYFDETKAKEHVIKAGRRSTELIQEYGWSKIPRGNNEFDPIMQVDYTGVEYRIVDVDLGDS